MTTVLTLEPLDFNVLGNTLKLQLRGIPCVGNTVLKVDYPASFQATSINKGVEALDLALHVTQGPKLVFAHSQGAQVVSRWLRQGIKVPDVRFLLIGNPLRKYGGYIIGKPEVGGQIGLPTPNDTDYPVVDLKMQYDGWADMPTKTGMIAALNASRGKGPRHCYGYLNANPYSFDRWEHKENLTTYVMLPGKPVIPAPQSVIEKAYDRPERPI